METALRNTSIRHLEDLERNRLRRPQACLRAVAVGTLLVACLFAADAATAFSKFERTDGETEGPAKTGIIAVPLPPLPSATGDDGASPAQTEEPEGTDGGEVPLSPEDEDLIDEKPKPAATPSNDEGPQGAPARPSPVAPSPLQPSANRAPAVPLASDIAYGEEGLPKPVADLRAKLMEIAKSGDVEKLRPYLEGGADPTVLSFGEAAGDPIEFLKSTSGDGRAIEILAIMLEVLEAGHAHVQPGDDEEIYVWPYFTQLAIDDLTKPQLVELFELVTAGDYAAMREFGAYNFYRLGITPDGKLQFFVAGD